MYSIRLTRPAHLLFLALAFLAFVSFYLSACTKKPEGDQNQSAPTSKTVNLAIWSNYLSPEMIEGFEKSTGIKIVVSNFSSNEELLAKLQAGAVGYDVIVPSDYMVLAMSKLGLIQELDKSQLPNFASLEPKFLNKAYDTGNKFSVPYDWGTTGFAQHRKLYSGQLKGWKDVFNTPALAGKFTMLDDAREVIGAALKTLGYSMNSRDPKELDKAKELLKKVRPKIKSFTSEPKMELINGESAVAQSYATDALQAAAATGKQVQYIFPEEGCTIWLDNLTIPRGAPHVREAHMLINYLIDAKTNSLASAKLLITPVNKDSMKLLPETLRSEPGLFPAPSAIAKCEMYEDLGEALQLFDKIWTEVKAQSE